MQWTVFQWYSEMYSLVYSSREVSAYKFSLEIFGVINQMTYNIHSIDPTIPLFMNLLRHFAYMKIGLSSIMYLTFFAKDAISDMYRYVYLPWLIQTYFFVRPEI